LLDGFAFLNWTSFSLAPAIRNLVTRVCDAHTDARFLSGFGWIGVDGAGQAIL